jgi:enoyl reductase-like protein
MSDQQTIFFISLGLSIIGLALAGYSMYSVRSLKRLQRSLGPEHQPENLEDILSALIASIKKLEASGNLTKEALSQNTEQTDISIKRVGLVKFNSFADEGGNLSFALALLDSQNSGVVVTSMHGRQQNRIYAKAVHHSVGEVPLNEEEQKAVMQAVENKNQDTTTV